MPASPKPRANATLKQLCDGALGRVGPERYANPVAADPGETMPKKLYIETVGCQMNVLDSELVVGSLRRRATS